MRRDVVRDMLGRQFDHHEGAFLLDALEAAFLPTLLAAGVPLADPWDVVPGLEAFLEGAGAIVDIDRQTRAGIDDSVALERAAALLGLTPDALRMRMARILRRASPEQKCSERPLTLHHPTQRAQHDRRRQKSRTRRADRRR